MRKLNNREIEALANKIGESITEPNKKANEALRIKHVVPYYKTKEGIHFLAMHKKYPLAYKKSGMDNYLLQDINLLPTHIPYGLRIADEIVLAQMDADSMEIVIKRVTEAVSKKLEAKDAK